MNKLILAVSAALISTASFAQDQVAPAAQLDAVVSDSRITVPVLSSNTANKTTGVTPEIYYTPYAGQRTGPFVNYYADRGSAAPYDSGRLNGISVYEFKAFAQYFGLRVDVKSPVDSSITVTGIVSRFNGAATSSSKSVTFSVWRRDNAKYAVSGRTKYFIGGVPQATAAATKNVAFNAINLTGKGLDTGSTVAMFATPLNNINSDVYVGYSIPAYTFSASSPDIFGLATVPVATGAYSGIRDSVSASFDTVITAYSLVQMSNNTWKSNFESGTGLPSTNGNLVIYPIVQISCATCGASGVGVNGIKHNDITFFGHYPNPAANSTNVKFALKNVADVTISVMDMSGKTISRVKESGLGAGEHIVKLNTAALSAGNYIYTVETSGGDGMAFQLSIVK